MITVGVDAHKQIHVAVAVDERGQALAHWQGANAPRSWQELLAWAAPWPEREWGIEGSGNYGRGLAQHLVAAGELVYEVNPRLTAQLRRRTRKQDKSDRLDAQAVARAVRQEGAGLPRVVAQAEATMVLAEVTRERRRLKGQVDRLRNQLHHRLFHLDPQYRKQFRGLSSLKTIQVLAQYDPPGATLVVRTQAAAVRRIATLLYLVLKQQKEIVQQLEELGKAHAAPLLHIQGIGAHSAAVLAGILGARQFATEQQFAAYAGAAPLEASSAGALRHRLNRGGNRRLNSVLYLVALTQWAQGGAGRSYIERKMAQGKSWLEGVRALKRFIARAIWRTWQQHLAAPTATPSGSRS